MTARPALSEITAAVCALAILLAPLAAIAVALVNTGLGRSRSAAHAMLSALAVLSVAGVAYCLFGFAFQGYAGGAAHAIQVGSKSWSWIAAERFGLAGLTLDAARPSLVALLGMVGAGLAGVIPLGSGADRWRLGASCLSTAVLAGWTFPWFAHWVWGGGWLAQLGANYGLGFGFIDVGGAGTIQMVGGLSALVVVWILGPRRGKYEPSGMAGAIPGHNSVLVMLGCALAFIGWTGLDAAGAILFAGMDAGAIVGAAVNNMMAAGAALLVSLLITRARFTKPDASLASNAWFGGLVAISAASALARPFTALVIGGVAGAVVTLGVEMLDRLAIDDPSGAVAVHGIAGLWGLLATAAVPGLERRAQLLGLAGSDSGQLLAQVAGIATLLGIVLPLTYGLNWALDRITPYRVEREGERRGMDLHELGAGAYPEFATHDEFGR
jgi:Amt family ammonium transporter